LKDKPFEDLEEASVALVDGEISGLQTPFYPLSFKHETELLRKKPSPTIQHHSINKVEKFNG